MRKAVLCLLSGFVSLWSTTASAQQTQAYWQGSRTSGHGVTFQNTGSGVTLQDAGPSPFYVVGMKCDGVTDDAPALRAAIMAAGANSSVVIPIIGNCIINSTIIVSLSNVTISGQGYGTILKRGASLTGSDIVSLSGTHDVISKLTVDGALIANPAEEIGISGQYGLVNGVKCINSRKICVALGSDFSGVMNSWLIGTGTTTDGFGVWAALGHVGNFVSGSIITGFTLNAVFIGGTSFNLNGNYLAGNHVQTSTGGGQIDVVTGSGKNTKNWSICNNVLDVGGGTQTYGIELNGDNGTGQPNNGIICGNAITAQGTNGIAVNDSTGVVGVTITGNVITDTASGPAVRMGANNSALQVVGNRLVDDRGSPTQTYCVTIGASSTNYTIVGNDCSGNLTGGVLNGGAGPAQILANQGALLNTSGTIAGAICATSAGLIVYKAGLNCF